MAIHPTNIIKNDSIGMPIELFTNDITHDGTATKGARIGSKIYQTYY
jgi:hypothetical protein